MEWNLIIQEAPWLRLCCLDDAQRTLVQRVWKNVAHVDAAKILGPRDAVQHISAVVVAQTVEVGVINSMYFSALRKIPTSPTVVGGSENLAGIDHITSHPVSDVHLSHSAKQGQATSTGAWLAATQVVKNAIDEGVMRTLGISRSPPSSGHISEWTNAIVLQAICAGIERVTRPSLNHTGCSPHLRTSDVTKQPLQRILSMASRAISPDPKAAVRRLTQPTMPKAVDMETDGALYSAAAREVTEAALEAGVARALVSLSERQSEVSSMNGRVVPHAKPHIHAGHLRESRSQPVLALGPLKAPINQKAIHSIVSVVQTGCTVAQARRTTFADTPTYYSQPNSPMTPSASSEAKGQSLSARTKGSEPRGHGMPRINRSQSEAGRGRSELDVKAVYGRRLRGEVMAHLTAWGTEEEGGNTSPESSFRQVSSSFTPNGIHELLSDLLGGGETTSILNSADVGSARHFLKNPSLPKPRVSTALALPPGWAIPSGVALDRSLTLEGSPRQPGVQSKGSASSLTPSTPVTSPAVATGIGGRAFTALQRLKDPKVEQQGTIAVEPSIPRTRTSWTLPSAEEMPSSSASPPTDAPTSSRGDPPSCALIKTARSTKDLLLECTREQTFDLEGSGNFSSSLGVRDQWTLAWKRKGAPNGAVEFESAKAVSRELMFARSPSSL